MTCNLLTQDTVLSWAVLNGPVLISVMWLAVSCDRLSRKAFLKVLRLSQSCHLLSWTHHCCLVLQYHLSLDNTQLPDSLSQFQFSIISPKILTFRTFAMVAGVVCHFTQSAVETRVWWTWNISWLTVYSSVLTITSTSTTYIESTSTTYIESAVNNKNQQFALSNSLFQKCMYH